MHYNVWNFTSLKYAKIMLLKLFLQRLDGGNNVKHCKASISWRHVSNLGIFNLCKAIFHRTSSKRLMHTDDCIGHAKHLPKYVTIIYYDCTVALFWPPWAYSLHWHIFTKLAHAEECCFHIKSQLIPGCTTGTRTRAGVNPVCASGMDFQYSRRSVSASYSSEFRI